MVLKDFDSTYGTYCKGFTDSIDDVFGGRFGEIFDREIISRERERRY